MPVLSLEPDKKTGTIKLLSPAQWLGETTAEDSVMIQKCGCDLLLECSGYVIVHMLSKMWAGLYNADQRSHRDVTDRFAIFCFHLSKLSILGTDIT